MKIIINRGFEKILTKIVVFKNGQEIIVCPAKKDYCELDAKEGDQIVIKLNSINTFVLTVASFTYHEGNDVFYISPTKAYKIWELLNFKIFPYLSLLFLAFTVVIESDMYKWFCIGMIVLTALSFICLQTCMMTSFMEKKWFKLNYL